MRRTLKLAPVLLVFACDSAGTVDDSLSAENTGGAPAGGGTESETTVGGAVASGGEHGVGGGGGPGAGGDLSSSGANAAVGGVTQGGSGGLTGSSGGASSGGDGGAAAGGSASGGSVSVDPTCEQGIWSGETPTPLTLSGNTFAHDPTMVKVGDEYLRYWTGDLIPSAKSSDLLNWSNAASVYPGGYPQWAQDWQSSIPGETFNFPWAPDVSFFGGKFHIYSSFSAIFGDNISCITHLSTEDPVGGVWIDHGPVFCTEGTEVFNAIDADVGIDQEGTPWLSFGSFWDGIFVFRLNLDGSREGSDLVRLAWASQIEAPVLFYRCGYYYLLVTWGLCCPGEGRSVDQLSYRVAVGRAQDILGPYLDREGDPLLEGGGTLLVEGDGQTWAAAGHSDVLFDGEAIYHFYHAYRQSDGGAQLRIVELPFDEEGWPVPGGP